MEKGKYRLDYVNYWLLFRPTGKNMGEINKDNHFLICLFIYIRRVVWLSNLFLGK